MRWHGMALFPAQAALQYIRQQQDSKYAWSEQDFLDVKSPCCGVLMRGCSAQSIGGVCSRHLANVCADVAAASLKNSPLQVAYDCAAARRGVFQSHCS